MGNKLDILRKFLNKANSVDDLRNLFLWLNSDKGVSEINAELDEGWKDINEEKQLSIDSKGMLSNIKKRIGKREVNRLHLGQIMKYAAMLIIALGAPFFFQLFMQDKSSSHYNDRYTCLITENGQRTKVVLPDSSIVWLNSGTTVSYLYNSKVKRSIILDGEAFFEVKKDKGNPFVVSTKGIEVKVLGTKFGVKSYKESDKVSVALASGSVEMYYGDEKENTRRLVPGQIADFNVSEQSLNVRKVDVDELVTWKDNYLKFKEKPMLEVIDVLERWCDVKVEVRDRSVYDKKFTATFANQTYQQIFTQIAFSCDLKVNIKGGQQVGEKPVIILSR